MAHVKRSVYSAFEIPVTPPSKKTKPAESEVEYLSLAPFNAYPKVLFQAVKINTSAVRTIVVKNPTNVDIHVELCKLPEGRGYTWSATEFLVPAGGEESVHINWCPIEAGNWRDVVKVKNKVKNVYISEIILCSSAVVPKKVMIDKNRSLQPVMNRYSLTANPTVRSSENIIAAGINRNTLTDITNNKTVILETSRVKRILKNQEVLNKENNSVVTPVKDDTFRVVTPGNTDFSECNVFSNVSRRETYSVSKGNMSVPSSSSPVLAESRSHEGTYIVQDERYSVDSLEGSEFYDSLEGQLSKGESNSEFYDSPFKSNIDKITLPKSEAFVVHVGGELITRNVPIKSGVTFKTKRRSVGKDKTPCKGKRNSIGRRSCRRSSNYIENKEIMETEAIVQESSGIQTTSIDTLVEREKTSSCRRSTFAITDRGLTPDSYTCIKSSVVITKSQATVESKSNNTNRRSTFSLRRNENVICGKSPVREKVSRDSTSRKSTFNMSSRETTSKKENNMCERSVTLPSVKEVTAKKGRNSMSRRSAIIIDKQILPDKHITSEQNSKIPSSHSTDTTTTVHPCVSKANNRRTFRKPSAFAIGIKKAAAVRRLVLTSVSSSSSSGGREDLDNENMENADEIIHKISNPDPFIAFTIRDPFSMRSIYLDEEWLDTQEKELIKWVNTMLTLPKELKEDFEAPENTVLHRLNAIRRATTSLLCSSEMSGILAKVKVAVDKKLIAIRNDRNLHVDIGMQSKVLQLLLCYNPLWLRLGLEAVYGRAIALRRNSDITGLTAFIRKHLLSDDYIKSSYCHHTVPHLMLPEFEDKMKKFTLCKFLMLIYVLDQAKNRKLIHHNPCLFRLDSPLKSSQEILVEFYKDLLSGMGDVMKQLRHYGYQLTYKQTYLDEFDFAVKTRLDLRDGIRLTRLAELMVQDRNLCSKLRVPPISRLQKVHNVEIAMKAFAEAKYTFAGDITSKSIVDGHKEKTLSLLWQLRRIQQEFATKLIITKWRETRQLRQDRKEFLKVRTAIVKIQNWYRKIKKERKLCKKQMEIDRNKFVSIRKAAITIQQWYRAIKLMHIQHEHYYNLRTTVIYIQRKYRNMYVMRKARLNYLQMKHSTIMIQQHYRANRKMKQERLRYLQIRNAVIIIQKTFRNILLMKRNQQIFNAAIKIQRAFRNYQIMKQDRLRYMEMKLAAIKIQNYFRATMLMRKEHSKYTKLKSSVIFIQTKYKANITMKHERNMYLRVRNAVITIQRVFRGYLLMKRIYFRYLEMKWAALVIQKYFRANQMMKTEMAKYRLLKTSVVFIQNKFIANEKMKSERRRYLKIRNSVIIIQKWYRATQLMKIDRYKYVQLKTAAVLIQNKFRVFMKIKLERNRQFEILSATVKIQRAFKNYQIMKQDRLRYMEMKFAAIKVQNYFRATVLMRKERFKYMKLKSSVIFIQTKYKANITMKHERNMYLKIRNAAITIQRVFRSYLLMKQVRCKYLKIKWSAFIIQKYFRANQMMKTEMSRYLLLKTSVVFVQNKFRANAKAKLERNRYLKIRNAVITIQIAFRQRQLAKQDHCRYLEIKSAVLILQKYFRAFQIMKSERSKYLALKRTAIFVQTRFRANKKMRPEKGKYLRLRNAAVSIQRVFRGYLIMKTTRARYLEMKFAAIVIQRNFKSWHAAKSERDNYLKLKTTVIFIQCKFRANMKMRNLRNEYLRMNNAVLIIQRAFRAKKLMIQEYNTYTSLKNAVVFVQRYFRARQLMKREHTKYLRIKSAVTVIQREFRNRKAIMAAKAIYLERKAMKLEEEKKHKAATTIQAVWRGYRCRKAMNVEVKKSKIDDDLVKQKTLRERSEDILDHLVAQPRSVKQITVCLYTLDTITTLSSKLCREFADGGIVTRLYSLLDTTCRSACDVVISELAIKVMINLYKYSDTADRTWQDTVRVNGIDILLDQMMNSYIKEDRVFCNAVTLLWLFAQDSSKIEVILSIPKTCKMLKYISHKVHEQKKKCAVKTRHHLKIVHEIPNTKHDWGYYEKPTAFTNKQVAIENLLKKLNILS